MAMQTLRWGLVHRIGFRFALAYWVLYVPMAQARLLDRCIVWMGQTLFGIQVSTRRNGSGDTTYNYMQLLLCVAASAIITLVWSVLDRHRPNYHRLHGWLHAWVRFLLGSTLIGYGMAKVIPQQFPLPALFTLDRTFYESSPMGILWTFMGASPGYTSFAGFLELIPGLLLFFQPTALLGALLGAAVLANVVALNLFYDVPVKLLSSHLLVMAIFVMLPDAGRMLHLLRNRPAPPREIVPLLTRRWVRVSLQAVKVVLLAWLVGWQGYEALGEYRRTGPSAPKPDLYGLYNVVETSPSGSIGWHHVFFDRARYEKGMDGVVGGRHMDGRRLYYSFHRNGNTLELSNRERYQIERISDSMLILKADGLTMKCAKAPDSLLLTRGFHWINEFPFNR